LNRIKVQIVRLSTILSDLASPARSGLREGGKLVSTFRDHALAARIVNQQLSGDGDRL
jgi:hypothetical protein